MHHQHAKAGRFYKTYISNRFIPEAVATGDVTMMANQIFLQVTIGLKRRCLNQAWHEV